jgi:hypothetical protein
LGHIRESSEAILDRVAILSATLAQRFSPTVSNT